MMTQTEYEDPKRDPVKMPIGSVIIDNFKTWKSTHRFAGRDIETRIYDLKLFGHYGWLYRTVEGSNVLYTMDMDGNAKMPSCFREPIEG